jgi:hypothetical protein
LPVCRCAVDVGLFRETARCSQQRPRFVSKCAADWELPRTRSIWEFFEQKSPGFDPLCGHIGHYRSLSYLQGKRYCNKKRETKNRGQHVFKRYNMLYHCKILYKSVSSSDSKRATHCGGPVFFRIQEVPHCPRRSHSQPGLTHGSIRRPSCRNEPSVGLH